MASDNSRVSRSTLQKSFTKGCSISLKTYDSKPVLEVDETSPMNSSKKQISVIGS